MLTEMGHKQPTTPLQTDNATGEVVCNDKIQPKRTKTMDMRFHWLRDRQCQEQFRIIGDRARPIMQTLYDQERNIVRVDRLNKYSSVTPLTMCVVQYPADVTVLFRWRRIAKTAASIMLINK